MSLMQMCDHQMHVVVGDNLNLSGRNDIMSFSAEIAGITNLLACNIKQLVSSCVYVR